MEFSLDEVKAILTSLSLTSVTMGDYLVVTRSEFDLIISGEPYIGLVLLLDLKTGKCLFRIWNQTVTTDVISTTNEFSEVCELHFGQGRPCLGCPEGENDKLEFEEGDELNF